ncbi:DNA polymerase epsilon subunit 3-like [Contarinia nasturtii]|uniref:DNA polymerase epsilon subunit 3-like n=1 Tax=Contarinia nasturtii TaxID=265458 RepID=UPI0012D4A80F|nr:DNA polymerase epsilon subunit 3-like [Contarinia nasturtii]
MVERIQDLNLPNTNIIKIIKDSLPSDVTMDKEARIAIARATSVFIMYLSSNAAAMAHKKNHKTFSAQDVLDSINEMDFKHFTIPMKNALITYQKSMKEKKTKKNCLEVRNTTVSPTKSVNNKNPTPTLTVSQDIIEIDDSD